MFIRVKNNRLINFDTFIQVEIIRNDNEGYCGLFGLTTKDNKRINIIRFDNKDRIENELSYQICEKILDDISVRLKGNNTMIDIRPNIKNILKQYVPEMINIDKKFCL